MNGSVPWQLEWALAASISPGQLRVVQALLSGSRAAAIPPPTYGGVATALGCSVGTVHTHLRRVRRAHPELYAAVMAERKRQLAEYHAEVVERERLRSLAWGRRRAAAAYRRAHGRWPWEDYAARRSALDSVMRRT
jgi:hypothetical protein